MVKFNYLDDMASEVSGYITIPKELYTGKFYMEKLSKDAVLLYGILKSIFKLSVRNNVKDEFDRYYVYVTVEAVMKYLQVSKNTARKIFKELETACLIKIEKGKGYNAPRRIYLGQITVLQDNYTHFQEPKSNTSRFNSNRSGGSNFGRNTGQKITPNNNYKNNNYINSGVENSFEYLKPFNS